MINFSMDIKTDKDIALIIKVITDVRKLITDDIKAKNMVWDDTGGTVDCPNCKKGKVIYSYAGSYNGHISATCNTENCVNWIE